MLCGQLFSQAQTNLIVNHADSLVARTIEGETIRELIGHVNMQQENIHITCERAIHNVGKNSAELLGNVVIIQDTLKLTTSLAVYDGNKKFATCNRGITLNDGSTTLTADIGDYKTAERIAHFQRGVLVEDQTSIVTADELTYYRDSSKAIAVNRVVITSKESNAIVTGDSVIHYVKKKISFILLHPTLWQVDTTVLRRDSLTGIIDSLRLDTLTIVCKRMEAYRDSTAKYITRDSVEIVRRDLAARCHEGVFYSKDSLVILRISPVLWYKDSQLTGDSIAAQLFNGTIQSMHVIGNAFAISRSKPTEKDSVYPKDRFDQSKGKNILMKFRDDQIDSVLIRKTAIRVYYVYDDRALNGVGVESGDQIFISFLDGKADIIKTVGGVEGKYYPEKMVSGNERSYNLDGFLWREDRPVQPMMIFPSKRTQEKSGGTR